MIINTEFLDDDLLRYKNEICELLQGIIDNKLEITWSANNGLIANSLDRELLELFRDTNCARCERKSESEAITNSRDLAFKCSPVFVIMSLR